MIHEQLAIQNKLGLHSRAAAKLVDIAKKYASRIEIKFHDRTVDAKSIMGVITLGAQKDHVIDIIVQGEDEDLAYDALKQLIDNKFGEE